MYNNGNGPGQRAGIVRGRNIKAIGDYILPAGLLQACWLACAKSSCEGTNPPGEAIARSERRSLEKRECLYGSEGCLAFLCPYRPSSFRIKTFNGDSTSLL